jgi:MFS family permease
MPSTAPIPRVFYGWWIVAAGFTIEALIGSLMFHAYGAYLVLLRDEFGWSKTLLSAAFAMARAESGILGPIQGWLTDRFGPRALIRVGMTIFGIGFMLFSQIGSPVTFIATYFLMALGSSLGGFLPVTVAIVNWFRRRRALALSISATGMATGGLLVQGVVLALSRFGWRWTAFASGVLVLLIGLPVAQIVRHRPEPYGYRVDGSEGSEPALAALELTRQWTSRREKPCAPALSG